MQSQGALVSAVPRLRQPARCVNVLTAIVQRLDNSHTMLLTEIRAIHSQVLRHGERLRRLESLAPTDSDKSAELSE